MRIQIFTVIVIAILAVVMVYQNSTHATKSRTVVMAELQQTKEIDKLYTGTYLVPAMDLNRGILKRDMASAGFEMAKGLWDKQDSQQKLEEMKVILGYCIKPIEVSFGYDELTKILSDETTIANVCSGKTSALPAPQILAANPQHDIIQGKYDANGACYTWGNRETRNSKILEQMREDGILEKAHKRGRESLKNFLAILCN